MTPEELAAAAAAEAKKVADAAAAAAAGGKKPDGRTEKAIEDDVARLAGQVKRLEVHTGIEETLAAGGKGGGDDDDEEDDEDEDEPGVDDILANGFGLGSLFDGDDEEEAAAA